MLAGEEVFKNPLEGFEDESLNGNDVLPPPSERPRCEVPNETFTDVDSNGQNSPGTIANDNRFVSDFTLSSLALIDVSDIVL